VRAGHDDDVVDRACVQRLEHARQKHLLLRRRSPVPGRRARSKDDGVDQLQPANAAQRDSTLAT
jgi:hypothetical protein